MNISQATLMASFPFPTIRPVQEQALQKVASTMEVGKKFTILEVPTGGGKSPVAMAISFGAATLPKEGVFNPGAHITTTQIILQRQYLRDFESMGLREIKGKSNYMCAHFEGGGVIDCATSSALHGEEDKCCPCTYSLARQDYMDSPVGVTNFSYFTTTRKAGAEKAMPSRQVLIVDEAHNTESELIGFGEVDITQSRLALMGLDKVITVPQEWPVAKKTDACKVWFEKTVIPKIKEKRLEFMAKAHQAEDSKGMLKYAKMAESLEHFKSKISGFLDSSLEDPWVIYNQLGPRGVVEGLALKPLYAHNLADQYLFSAAQHVVLMSATILGARVFARNLGIGDNDFGFKRFDSDFPAENRQVFFDPIGSMSFKQIDRTLPIMAKRVEKACKANPTTKGMIHTNSYKVTKGIVDHLTDIGMGNRVITHNSDRGSRDAAVARHISSPEPTILISPSLTEGLDLAGDLSRWQILTKVPYPSLGDLWIKTRMELDAEWYAWKTALAVIQASGRSVRSKEDHATTYIFDSDFGRLLERNGNLFPQWWKDALV